MRPIVPHVLGAIVLVWSVVSAAATWRAAATRPLDHVAGLDADFSTLARSAPPSDRVGFLKHFEDADSADHILVYYVAQYAFAPRLVVRDVEPPVLLVARNAARPIRDERLDGFVLVASSRNGHLLYRRLSP